MHFSVGVLSKQPHGFVDLLASFQKNNMGNCLKQHLEFLDVEEKYLDIYKNGIDKRVVMPDDRLLLENDREFDIVFPHEVPFSEYDYDCLKLSENEKVIKIIPEGLEIKEFLFEEIYSTFEEFLSDYYGFSKDKEIGKYGYWYNPNVKWDRYELGGRWRGLLLVQKNKYCKIGNWGNLKNKEAPEGYKWVDSAKIKDIEWDLMKKIKDEYVGEKWEEIQKSIQESKEKGDYLSVAFFNTEGSKSKELYIKKNSFFITYSVLTPDGKWHDQCGKLKDWKESYFNNFLKNVDLELYFSIVDCHI